MSMGVTDEWLDHAWRNSLDIPDTMQRAFAQAVARECVRLASERAATWEDTHPLDGTVPLWIGYVAADIRARFGLED